MITSRRGETFHYSPCIWGIFYLISCRHHVKYSHTTIRLYAAKHSSTDAAPILISVSISNLSVLILPKPITVPTTGCSCSILVFMTWIPLNLLRLRVKNSKSSEPITCRRKFVICTGGNKTLVHAENRFGDNLFSWTG